jgi:twitching motility protein PilT
MVRIDTLLKLMVERGASALHLSAGAPPTLRVDGQLVPSELDKLTTESCQALVYSILNGSQKARFESDGEVDTSFGIKGVARLRMIVFRQRGSVAAALRLVPTRNPTLAELGLPAALESLVAAVDRGLLLVAGASGAGKSNTVASVVDWINRNRSAHILTVERSLERLHYHERSIVNQVETGYQGDAFLAALQRAHRQDADVVVISELDDPETVPTALSLAESGRLVLATLHAPDAISAVARLLDAFPPHRQDRARSQLSLALQAVLVQSLLPHASGRGRVLACEFVIANPTLRAALRAGRLEDLPASIPEARDSGAQSMNESLAGLVAAGRLSRGTALAESPNPDELAQLLTKRAAKSASKGEKQDQAFNPLKDLDSNALEGILSSI